MKKNISATVGLMLLLAAPPTLKAQSGSGDNFDYSINGDDASTVTITNYTGTSIVVAIPTSINGLTVTGIGLDYPPVFNASVVSVTVPNSVTSIGDDAFENCSGLTNVTIPDSIVNIGAVAFSGCTSLASLTFGNGVRNIGSSAFAGTALTSVSIPNSVTNIGDNAFAGMASLTNVIIGNGVTIIGEEAFYHCTKLTTVIVGSGVSDIENDAFWYCTSLQGAYFKGNAPSAGQVFEFSTGNVYYLPGTTGWGFVFGGLNAEFWVLPYPQILTFTSNFGVLTNRFGFTVSWATNASIVFGGNASVIVVEACTNLSDPTWQPLQTNTLASGVYYFADPQWKNYPSRFYRISSP